MDDDPLNRQERLARHLNGAIVGKIAMFALKLSGIELPRSVQRGTGLRLPHGAVGLVVHGGTVLGDDVRLYQGVTIGRSDQYLRRDQVAPGGGVIIGSRVVVGAGAVVLFRGGEVVVIGDDAIIGANAVVLRSVPPGEIWAGSPAVQVGRNPNAR